MLFCNDVRYHINDLVYNTVTEVASKRSDYNRVTIYAKVVKSDIIDINKSNCFKKRGFIVKSSNVGRIAIVCE